MREVPRRKVDLGEQDRERLRDAWTAFRQAQADAERSRRQLVTLLRRLQKKYPVAAIARAAGVAPMAVWNKLKK